MTRPNPELHQWLIDTLDAAEPDQLQLIPLQTEASFRQFYRVIGAHRPLVLMDSPPAKEHNPQFVAVAHALAAQRVVVPEILAHNVDAGWLLLSDLGNTHFIDAYRENKHNECLSAALQTLKKIAAVNDPVIPPYSPERLSDELNIFVDWLVAGACKIALPDTLFEPVRKVLLATAAGQPKVCVHRDFHCKNLLINNGLVGVLDFQDALIGPEGYDLASLLHDCYWKFSDDVIDSVVDNVPNTDRRTIDLLATQRQLKAIGIFARLASRDDKTSHLQHIGPVLKNLIELSSRYPELKQLGLWLDSSLSKNALAWAANKQSAGASQGTPKG